MVAARDGVAGRIVLTSGATLEPPISAFVYSPWFDFFDQYVGIFDAVVMTSLLSILVVTLVMLASRL